LNPSVFRLAATGGQILLLTVYLPGSTKPTSAFVDEFAAVLEVMALQNIPIVVGGDFNVRLNDVDTNAARLSEMLTSFGMRQHVTGHTHRSGGTLDVIITLLLMTTHRLILSSILLVYSQTISWSVADFRSRLDHHRSKYVVFGRGDLLIVMSFVRR